jgi:hypothetical protein
MSLVAVAGWLAVAAAGAGEDAPPLSLADLGDYRAALAAPKGTAPAPVPVTFRDLWDHPERYKGRRVQVEGKVVRRFRQGAVGSFPALEEAWAVTPAGDPFCLVFPDAKGSAGPAPDSVRFAGTFLRTIRFAAKDTARLAPLIVGPRPPETIPSAAQTHPPGARFSGLDWMLGVGAALVVAFVLAWQHARKPVRRPTLPEIGLPPQFVRDPFDNHNGSH